MSEAEKIADLELRVQHLEQAVFALIEDNEAQNNDRPAVDLGGNEVPPIRNDLDHR